MPIAKTMAISPPMPPNEPQRLDALRHLDLLDSGPEPAYEALAQLAARLIGTPLAAVSLIDADRQWIKAGVGLRHGDEDPRDVAFCAHAIAAEAEPWVVNDAAADPRFADNPLVTGGRVGFYAGAPVRTADGHALGTLCVIDPQPREIGEQERETLRTLAAAVSAHVEAQRQRLLANERHAALAAVLEHAPEAFLRIDQEGAILGINRRAETLFGWERDAIIGRRVLHTLVPDLLCDARASALASAILAGERELPGGAVDLPVRHRDGHEIPVELTVAAVETKHGLRFNVFARDITERVERERERQEETEALAALVNVTSRLAGGLDDGVLRDQLCDAACQIAGAHSAALFIADGEGGLIATGTNRPGLRDLHIAPDAHSLALESYRSGVASFASDAPAQGWPLAGHFGARAVATQPVIVEGRCIGVLSVFWDTARPQLGARTSKLLKLLVHEAATAFARSALFARLAQQSRTDALTGALNRRALDDELHLALLNARRDSTAISIAVLDLDHFKAYNDTFGHTAGDTLLKGACAAWGDALRSGDVLARFGGEEFVIVLPGCALSDAQALIDRLRARTPSGQTCSAGVAMWDGAEAASELIVRADQALYRAKDRGRDMVCVA